MATEVRGKGFVLAGVVLLFLTLLLLAAGVVLYALREFDEKLPVDSPYAEFSYEPDLVRDGGYLFRLACAYCHVDRDDRLGSHTIQVLPEMFGTVRVPNLSRDPLFGISGCSDGELWFSIHHNIRTDGQSLPLPVPPNLLTDKDLESLLIFLRYDTDLAEPVSTPSIPSEYSLVGKVLSVFYSASRDFAKSDLLTPVSRGEYLAQSVMGCLFCHSPGGFQIRQEDRFTGSGEKISSGSRQMIAAPALRGEKSLLRWYNFSAFRQLLQEGITFDGNLVEMPLHRDLRIADIRELWQYFEGLETNPEWRPESMLETRVVPSRGRVVAPDSCSSCHSPVPETGSAEFIQAHALPSAEKSLYLSLRAATFHRQSTW